MLGSILGSPYFSISGNYHNPFPLMLNLINIKYGFARIHFPNSQMCPQDYFKRAKSKVNCGSDPLN